MEFREVLRRRRMVRCYRPDPVDPEILERVLRTALRGPSAGFSQGVHLVVVTRADLRRALAELAQEPRYRRAGFPPWLSRAPVHVVLCCSPEDYRRRYREPDKGGSPDDWPVPYWYLDAGAALMLLLLAAVEEGLAAGFLGGHRLAGVGELLGIPRQVLPLGLVTLGYPAPDRPSRSLLRGRRPPREVLHREGW